MSKKDSQIYNAAVLDHKENRIFQNTRRKKISA